jgi:nitrite reductase/ring-hydroxylating ferredoxin subunit
MLHLSKLIKLNLFHNYKAKICTMKKYLFLLILLPFLMGCDKDDNTRNNNPFLPSYNFSIDINLELPTYSQLQFPSNPVRIFQAGIGIGGIVVMNTGSGFNAFEVSCPNQALSDCSTLTVSGINVKCPCDNAEYSLFTGLGPGRYPLLQYRVDVISPTLIRVYN